MRKLTMNDTPQPKHGKLLWLVLGLLTLSACPSKSTPPIVEVCLGDGFGGADCIEHDQTKLYRSPSMMLNYWCTNQPDEAAYAQWATGASAAQVKQVMESITNDARGSQ